MQPNRLKTDEEPQMEQYTVKTGTEHISWLETLVDVVRKWNHEAQPMTVATLTEALEMRIGGDRTLAAVWIQSCEVMTQYTDAGLDEKEDAIDEELAAVVASRRAFRPLLEARLQARIDRIDEATKG